MVLKITSFNSSLFYTVYPFFQAFLLYQKEFLAKDFFSKNIDRMIDRFHVLLLTNHPIVASFAFKPTNHEFIH